MLFYIKPYNASLWNYVIFMIISIYNYSLHFTAKLVKSPVEQMFSLPRFIFYT